MHLTLKFLGDVSPNNLEFLVQMLRNEAALIPCFEIHLAGLGSFPNPKRPRVLYVGIQAPAALLALQRGIESAARRLGYGSEERPFSAHLTLGRIRQNATAVDQQKIRRALEGTQVDVLGSARVDLVHLYKSDLNPGGSIYTRLHSAPLKK
jgi:2'-5' RNA ligase